MCSAISVLPALKSVSSSHLSPWVDEDETGADELLDLVQGLKFQGSVRLHQSPVQESGFDFSLIPLCDFLLSPSNLFLVQFISSNGPADGGPSFIRHLFFHLASLSLYFSFSFTAPPSHTFIVSLHHTSCHC